MNYIKEQTGLGWGGGQIARTHSNLCTVKPSYNSLLFLAGSNSKGCHCIC